MSLYTPAPPRSIRMAAPDPAPRQPVKLRFRLLLLLVGTLTLAGVLLYGLFRSGASYTDARMMGAPVRAQTAAGDRVYVATGQWRTFTLTTGRYVSSTVRTTKLLIDLWTFDERAQPVKRVRLLEQEDGAMADVALLGAVSDTLWIFLKGKLLGYSMAKERLVVDPDSLVRVNPSLRGLLPDEERYYGVDGGGLYFLGLDGRHWRVDAETFVAFEATDAPAPVAAVVRPAYFTPASVSSFQVRGLEIPGFWLGLLTEAESTSFNSVNGLGYLDGSTRRRLWRARAIEKETFFGKQNEYVDFAVLPSSPEYLGAGLLALPQPTGMPQPLWANEPDSVFVLHRDKLGDAGLLHLSRVSGPMGSVVWETALPLSMLQCVLPGEKTLMLYGCQFTPAVDDSPRDPMHTAEGRLLAIDLATGELHVQDQAAVDRHPEAMPVEGPE